MLDFANAYAEIVKFDKQDDGTMLVYGKATDDSLDVDLQICDPGWLDKAMPEWFKSGGNIREQHSNIAAGVAQEYEKTADGHYIGVLVVDPISVKKVEARVLKGFSIGIKSPRVVRDQKAANGRIIDGQIVEISLVDRPANPNAKLVLAKSVDGGIVQVEEFTEQADLLAFVKSVIAEIPKFDQAAYDSARGALATLVQVEAGEMSEGHDEVESLSHLLEAIRHLSWWYQGEVREGEVAGEESGDQPMDTIALSPTADADKTVEPEVTETSEESSPVEGGETDKSSDSTESESIEQIVAKAVQTAMEPILTEVASLTAAKEAAEQKSAGLEGTLQEALNKAAGGGPKRTSRTSPNSLDDNAVKAAQYRAKAAAATDPLLAKGYAELATEFANKVTTPGE